MFKIPPAPTIGKPRPSPDEGSALGIGAFEAVERECSSEAKIHLRPGYHV